MSSSQPTRGHRIARQIVLGLLRLLRRLHVEGVDRVPESGPFLLVSNHLHWMDIPMLGATLPLRGTVFAAHKWQRRPFVGWILQHFGDAIWVHRGEVDRRALREAVVALQRGAVLAVAPEGTRSRTGALQPGKEGAAYLAAVTGVPVVPVVAYGQEQVFSCLRRGRRADVYVRYGLPFAVPRSARRVTRQALIQLTDDIMFRLAAMLPPRYRGVYGSRRADDQAVLATRVPHALAGRELPPGYTANTG